MKNINKLMHSVLIFILLSTLVSCSTFESIPNEKFHSEIQDEHIISLIAFSSIRGYYNVKNNYIPFDSSMGEYDASADRIFGIGIDGQKINFHIDSVFAIKMRHIDFSYGVSVKPEQFKIEIQKKPSRNYNPCWDYIQVIKNSVNINNKESLILGVTKKGNSFNIPLQNVYEIHFQQKNRYKTISYLIAGLGAYLFINESKEQFKKE